MQPDLQNTEKEVDTGVSSEGVKDVKRVKTVENLKLYPVHNGEKCLGCGALAVTQVLHDTKPTEENASVTHARSVR
jgi:hypothetical protein